MFLLDKENNILAKIKISEVKKDLYLGNITEDKLSDEVRSIFLDYENIICGQMFSLLDEIESKVSNLGLAVSQEESIVPIKIFDLQIMSDGEISFRQIASQASRSS